MGDGLGDFMEKFKAVCIPARTPTAEYGKGETFKDRGRQIHTSILEPPALTPFMGENRSELETHSGKPLSSR